MKRRAISLKTVLEPVAEALGNTPAISRKSYVHPKLIEAARDRPRNPLNGWSVRAGANGCRPKKLGCSTFLAEPQAARRESTPRLDQPFTPPPQAC